jgi:hypothetical protein
LAKPEHAKPRRAEYGRNEMGIGFAFIHTDLEVSINSDKNSTSRITIT